MEDGEIWQVQKSLQQSANIIFLCVIQYYRDFPSFEINQ